LRNHCEPGKRAQCQVEFEFPSWLLAFCRASVVTRSWGPARKGLVQGKQG